MDRMPLCENTAWPGEPVIVAVPEGTRRGRDHVAAVRKFRTEISDVENWEFGGLAYSMLGCKCLLGIMSRKISVCRTAQMPEGSKKILRNISCLASTIRAFIPPIIPFRELASAPST